MWPLYQPVLTSASSHHRFTMNSSPDPRFSMSTEAGPSRCHMESSFYSILHSSGFAEWAARAESQNSRLRAGGKLDGESSLGKHGDDSSSPVRSLHTSSDEAEPRTAQTSKKSSPDAASRLTDEAANEAEQSDDGCHIENFTWHYSNYSSMDAELMILKKHLMKRTRY
ncbi:hypothetical protein L249_0703 [Ophiocordyceps polyrhachis-furcata BCC 54312]|uniref:Uncharacterized protein n=1 Tax=Ophiocordyceps polyrhachis-furcata BCC 54312 TaxID=1330021 RepID=A0A367LEK1_9HYPO|nr:hypothetical protein L249_0703 [Ophiocordyceps polyrhachis-furcata BCC 54312]